jgi:hypothetical protein
MDFLIVAAVQRVSDQAAFGVYLTDAAAAPSGAVYRISSTDSKQMQCRAPDAPANHCCPLLRAARAARNN